MTTTATPVDNGVNVEALLGAREALTAAPEGAQFKWRATCKWVNGTHSQLDRRGLLRPRRGAEPPHRVHASTPTTRRSSPPRTTAPRRSSIVLVGLAGCLTAGVAAVAQHREIQLRSVTATLEGDMDVRGILGIDSDVRNGFSGIKVTYNIDADATPDEIKALVAQSQKRSAVYDIITNPTNVTVEVELSRTAHEQGAVAVRTTTVVIGAGHGRARHEPVPRRALDRPRGPRAGRGRQLVADRALGFAPPAHAQLAEPAARLRATTATTPTAS